MVPDILCTVALQPVKQNSSSESLRRDARENRARVLRAARELLAERGVDVEMKELADRAGVGVGTLYRNFPSKEALIDAVIVELREEMRPHVLRALENPDALVGATELLRNIFEQLHSHGAVIASVFSARPASLDSARDDLRPLAVRLIERGVDQGVFRDDVDPDLIAHFLQLSVPEAYLRLREYHPHEVVAAALLSMLLGALGATRPPESS